MRLIAGAVFIVLTAIAALHAAWAFGVRWPARNERDLVALVIGHRERTRMPSVAETFLAAAAIFAAGLVALAVADLIAFPGAPSLVSAAGVAATLVFAGRGTAAYLPAWRARFPQEPFATMDRRFYAPLCLLLATGFALLVSARLRA